MPGLVLRGAAIRCAGATLSRDVAIEGGLVRAPSAAVPGLAIDLAGRLLTPAFVNAHDVLDLATLPPLGRPPYASLYDWIDATEGAVEEMQGGLAVPFADRLFLGGVRNLLAGVAAVLHHHPDHRSLGRDDFPVRVQGRYAFAHSPRLTPALRRTYRTSDRRIPWVVRAAEGRDPELRSEIDALRAANVLRQNTVIAHGTALVAEDGPRLAAARSDLVWCPEADLRLYGTTAPAIALRASGVRVGLGSDGAPAGARDFLSSLAVARREGGLEDDDALDLATCVSGAVARLPVGGVEEGAAADFLATSSLEALLAGDRRAVALLVVRGTAVYGEPALLAGAQTEPVVVDGEVRSLARPIARRLATLLRRHPASRRAAWLDGVALL